MTRRRLSSTARESLWDCECAKASATDRGDFPICNICELPVLPSDRWHESHYPVPAALDGQITGVAHAACNLRHAAQVDVPMIARVKRMRRRAIGAHVSRRPLPGGRDDPRKKTLDGRVVDRRTGAEWNS